MTIKGTKQKFSSNQTYNFYLNLKMEERNLTNNDLYLSNERDKFYGRISLNGNIITPTANNLKQLPGSDSQYALNFVCDAFEHLVFMCSSRENIIESKDFRFLNIKATKGYSSLENKYNKHITEIFNLYLKEIKNSNKNKKIIDFETFILDFIKFINISANKIPILKSDFIISNKCDILDSGLAIETINIQKYQNDRKVAEFWEAPEFYKFIENCKKCGFIVDKECPWRIVFNVNLEQSKKYMSKYDVDSKTYLNLYKINNEIDEINNLKKYMLIFYNKICSIEEQIQIPYIDDTGKVVYNNFVRKTINTEQLKSKYPDEFWFKIYSHIYFVKNNIKLNQKQYNEHMNKLIQLFKISNTKGVEYLNNILSNSPRSFQKGYEFTL